ncbi:MAG: flagellar biosynthetic protein FliO [Aliidongia sp.]
MTPDSYPRYIVSLLFVIGLIGLLAWLLRRFGPPGRFRSPGRKRLSIVEILPIDARRRLVLLRRDGKEHLILLGQTQDLVIESGIEPPRDTVNFSTHLDSLP